MIRKTAFALIVLFAAAASFAYEAHAGGAASPIKPQVVQACLKAAGIDSEILLLSPEGVPCRSLHVADLGGSDVTIGFPAGGLLRGRPFYLEIDGMSATVKLARGGRLVVVDGDSGIEAASAFSLVGCILGAVIDMVEAILENVASLNILGIIASVLTGAINIVGCI